MLFGADDVRDLHVGIIDNGREVVEDRAIAAHDDRIGHQSAVPFDVSAHGVVDGDLLIARDEKPHNERSSRRFEFLPL